jgi:hypothetical protein
LTISDFLNLSAISYLCRAIYPSDFRLMSIFV